MSAPTHNTAVLLVNLGSPAAPTPKAVRRFLKQFLGDPRVVQLPRLLWWLILHGAILPFRAKKSAHAYQQIWTEAGSPLTVFTAQLTQQVRALVGDNVLVDYAMSYSEPSITQQLERWRQQAVEHIVILPLYPQYSTTTTASVYDSVIQTFNRWQYIPQFTFISDYHAETAYIDALAASVQTAWQTQRGQLLLMSFHGLPEKLVQLGDPYYAQCQRTASLLAEKLRLSAQQWQLVFQSRFGRAQWLKPYCAETLQQLPQQGVKHLDVICPGFAVDCLETLEEMALTNKALFLAAGGETYRYLPALNATAAHAAMLVSLFKYLTLRNLSAN